MLKKTIFTLSLLLMIQLSAFSNPLDDLIEKIGERPKGKLVNILWSGSMGNLNNRQIIHRSFRSYEYIDNTDGDSKYLQVIFYPSNVAGNAILSLEKERKTYLYNKDSDYAMEVEYYPPKIFFDFYIPDDYEVLEVNNIESEEGMHSIKITDGELDYEYTINGDNVPVALVINDHFTSELIAKTEYLLFTNNFRYGNEFLAHLGQESWYSLFPYHTYAKNRRDCLITDFPDEIFSLEFLESLE